MLSPKMFAFFGAMLLVGLTFTYFMGGIWFTNDGVMNSLVAIKVYDLGLFKIPFVNVDFFTIGVPKLVQFDFAFFGGGYAYFRYVMYIFAMGFVWGLVILTINVVSGFFTRR